jgi:hypothetical protein
LYIIIFTDNFGGQAYGPRWFIAVTPPLFFFAAEPTLYRSGQRWLILAALSAVSVFAAWQGAPNPWGPALPPLRLGTSASSLAWPTPLAPQVASIQQTPRLGEWPNPVRVNFGDKLALLGYDVNARVFRPGETIRVTLYWQTLGQLAQDYNVFAHLADASGNVVAANDGLPYTQPKRTTRWMPGQAMHEVRSLELPVGVPAGLYGIELGVFDETEGRQPIVALDGHYLSEQLDLVPVRVTSR